MNIASEDHRVDSGLDRLSVFVRNKRPAAGSSRPPVLFVHGATYPSSVVFDYPVEGLSWMDWMAARGFDAWCVDLPGYGMSDRPAALSQAAEANPPTVRTADAEAAVVRVAEFILGRRRASRLSLVGYSWGTAICGGVATRRPDLAGRLVLSGALWCREQSVGIRMTGPLGAWREVTAEAIVQRWGVNLDATQLAAIADAGHMQAWAEAAVASDPGAGRATPPVLRAPTGVIDDVQKFWLQGKATWDPSAVQVPTLVVVGEWDRETTPEQGRQVFDRLPHAIERRMTVIGGGTHSLLLERQRHQLYRTVGDFLTV